MYKDIQLHDQSLWIKQFQLCDIDEASNDVVSLWLQVYSSTAASIVTVNMRYRVSCEGKYLAKCFPATLCRWMPKSSGMDAATNRNTTQSNTRTVEL
jgi:hypothetical protein